MPKHHIAGTAALLLLTAPAAWAEIDARTIWIDWQDVASRLGGTLTAASETYADGTLTLTDVSMAAGGDGAEGTGSYGTITMIEQDDGTLRIEVPARVATTGTTIVDGETVEQDIEMTYDGTDIVVREEAGVRTYDMAMDALTAVMTTQNEGPAAPTEVTFTMSDVVSTYRSGIGGDPDAFDQSTTADGLGLSVSSRSEGETVDLTYALTGLRSEVEGSYGDAPTGSVVGLSDLGVTYAGDISHSGGTLAVDGKGSQGPFSIESTSGAGELTFDLGDDSLGYVISSTDIDATVEAPGLPVPVGFSLAESTAGFTLPLGETGVAMPFAVALSARELELGDTLWGLFDPTGQLPRDPATLVVDMDGTAVMNVDLFGDPAAMARLQGPPGDLKTLNLNQLLLTLAGAELRASGTLEFPEVTPVPEPVGIIELALDGGFALADRLVALGLIPQEQAAFVKGMTGAVARTVGEDQLESTIEFTPGGGISANGLPLK